MAGALPFIAAAQQFAARAAGTLDAPEVLQNPSPPLVNVGTAAEGLAAIQRTKAMGGSFVKVVGIGPQAPAAILAEADKQGLDVAATFPLASTRWTQPMPAGRR